MVGSSSVSMSIEILSCNESSSFKVNDDDIQSSPVNTAFAPIDPDRSLVKATVASPRWIVTTLRIDLDLQYCEGIETI